jgi:sRNA-binding carbon storage regulator CsrA
MLLLERKRNEKVKVVSPSGEHCFVQVIRDKGDKVVLGFQFPKDYKILRDELEPHGAPIDSSAKAA